MTAYDAIVIGAGQAGPGVAASLVADGKRVALIEMERAGGTCLNHGCKPTKALRASASVAHQARRAAAYGVGTGEVTVDFPVAIGRVRSIIGTLQQSLDDWINGLEGLDYSHGTAKLRSDPAGEQHQVTVGDQVHTAPEVYLNVGARASLPRIAGLDSVAAMTEVELLALNELPAQLIVVGGGYIGLEFGQMFQRFGSQVTIIAGSGVAGREDEDVAKIITDLLTGDGVRIVPGRPAQIKPDAAGVSVELDDGTTITGSHLLVATGRRSNSDLLGDHGVQTDERGFFVIDGRFQTSVKGIWALGDVNGHGAWTHTAYQDSQILLDPPRSVDGRVATYAMFTDPPLGRVGMGLQEARQSGRNVLKAEVPMSSVSRAVLESETVGLLRILVDSDTEEILGATIFGLHADDLVQIISLAMQAGVTYPTVRDTLPIHPTMAEYIPSVLRSLQPLD
ncbi:MAG TPA: mercuric reductase [Propionibacteriaceae bacterium]|nr:mercuric reductase [Propionibacteriaceae bacterium]